MDRKGLQPGRELIGMLLLLLLLLVGMGVSLFVTRQQEQTAALLEDAAWEAMAQDWDRAESLCTEARSRWRQGWKLTASFGDHSAVEEVDALFSQLGIYAAAREGVDFASVCGALATHIRAIGNAQRPSWWNVL